MAGYISKVVQLRKKFFDHYKKGDIKEAIQVGEEMVSIYRSHHAFQTLEYANDINNVANAWLDINENNRALTYYKQAAAIRKKLVGDNSLAYADTLNNMAIALSGEGKRAQAKEAIKSVILIRRKNLGETHKDYCMALFNLSSINEDMGNLPEAERIGRKALIAYEKCDEKNIDDYTDLLIGLGRICAKRGVYKLACESYEKAVDLLKEKKEKDIFYLTVLLNTAEALKELKKYKKSIAYYESALRLREKFMERTHLDYVVTLNNLASVYKSDEQTEKAITLHQEVLKLVKDITGENHDFYAQALDNLGDDYCDQNDFDQSMYYHLKAQEIRKETVGEKHIYYTTGLLRIGDSCLLMHKMEEAEEYFQQALCLRKERYGEENADYLEALMAIGGLRYEENRLDEAQEIFEKALQIREKIFSHKDEEYAINLKMLALISSQRLEFDKAIQYSMDSLVAVEEAFGKDHPMTAKAYCNLGDIQRGAGRYRDAMESYQAACEKRIRLMGRDSVDYLISLSSLAQVQYLCGKYESAADSCTFIDRMLEKEEFRHVLSFCGNCVLSARVHEKLEDFYAVEKEYDRAFAVIEEEEISPDEKSDYYRFAAEYYQKNQEFEKALSYCKNAEKEAESEENHRRLLELKTEILSQFQGAKAALDMLRDYKSVPFQDEVLFCQGKMFQKLEDYAQASTFYGKAERAGFEKKEELYRLWGQALIKTNQLTQAAEKLKQAKEIWEQKNLLETPQYRSILRDLSKVYLDLGSTEKAIELLRYSFVLERRDPQNDVDEYRKRVIAFADLLSQEGRLEEAVEYYSEGAILTNQLFGEKQEYLELMIKTAKTDGKIGRRKEAQAMFTKACDILETLKAPPCEIIRVQKLRADLWWEEEEKKAFDEYKILLRRMKEEKIQDIGLKKELERQLSLYLSKKGKYIDLLWLKLGKKS